MSNYENYENFGDEPTYESVSSHTPCDEPDFNGFHSCPYSTDPSSDTCRNFCGLGVDE